MAKLLVEEPGALMRARPGLWEPWEGNDPGPPGPTARKVVKRRGIKGQLHTHGFAAPEDSELEETRLRRILG
jgi:hypothetical protein